MLKDVSPQSTLCLLGAAKETQQTGGGSQTLFEELDTHRHDQSAAQNRHIDIRRRHAKPHKSSGGYTQGWIQQPASAALTHQKPLNAATALHRRQHCGNSGPLILKK